MPKRVVVIASGETERRALPYLLAHLQDDGIAVSIRIPPRHRAITVDEAYKIIQSTRYDFPSPPDKYVVLVDVDGKDPAAVLASIQAGLPLRLGAQFPASVQYAYSQWHLEAWFFADANNLRTYLGQRDLGSVDPSQPDAIENPKQHLKNLLDGVYTARTSENIARTLDARTISQRSRSFGGFLEAVNNGAAHPVAY